MSVSNQSDRVTSLGMSLGFSAAMAGLSLLLNGILYGKNRLAQRSRRLMAAKLLPPSAVIRSIHRANPREGESWQVRQGDIVNHLTIYHHILNISRMKAIINTLLLGGLGLSAVLGVLRLFNRQD